MKKAASMRTGCSRRFHRGMARLLLAWGLKCFHAAKIFLPVYALRDSTWNIHFAMKSIDRTTLETRNGWCHKDFCRSQNGIRIRRQYPLRLPKNSFSEDRYNFRSRHTAVQNWKILCCHSRWNEYLPETTAGWPNMRPKWVRKQLNSDSIMIWSIVVFEIQIYSIFMHLLAGQGNRSTNKRSTTVDHLTDNEAHGFSVSTARLSTSRFPIRIREWQKLVFYIVLLIAFTAKS